MGRVKKYLVVTMPDHTRWRIPAQFVAEHYAARFPGTCQAVFDDEVAFVLNDDYELENWATNIMSWSDVVSVAERLPDEIVECDYERAWATIAVKEVLMMPFEAKVVD